MQAWLSVSRPALSFVPVCSYCTCDLSFFPARPSQQRRTELGDGQRRVVFCDGSRSYVDGGCCMASYPELIYDPETSAEHTAEESGVTHC